MTIKNEKKVLGWIFIVLGFLILITPFTPGSVLLLIGLHMVYGERFNGKFGLKEKIIRYFKGWRK